MLRTYSVFTFFFSLLIVFCADMKSHHDDGDSGMGPSISTVGKSTSASEVRYCLPQSIAL